MKKKIFYHCCLKSTDRIDFCHDNTCTLSSQRLAATFTDISKSSNNSDLSATHHISSTEDSVNQGVSASIDVIEFTFGDRIVDIQCREQKFSLLEHLFESHHSSGSFFRDSLDIFDCFVPVSRMFLLDSLQQFIHYRDFFIVFIVVKDGRFIFCLIT